MSKEEEKEYYFRYDKMRIITDDKMSPENIKKMLENEESKMVT